MWFNVVILATIVFVYWDATKNKIGKIPDEKGFFNLSAGLWATGTALLWIVVFPAYLIKRDKLLEKAKTHPIEASARPAKLTALCLVGALFVFSVLSVGTSRTALELEALAQMDTVGFDFFCSSVLDKGLINVTTGTATGGNGGTTRFPAIMANYDGVCVNALTGDRDLEFIRGFWIFFALDSEASTLRCILNGTDETELFSEASERCAFVPE